MDSKGLYNSHFAFVQTNHTLLVAHRFSGGTFYLTLVYGDNDELEKRKLWEMLQTTATNIAAPWIIMGDFNHLLHLDDRIGGLPVTQHNIRDFQQCLCTIGVQDLNWKGCRPGLRSESSAQEFTLELIAFLSMATGWTPI